MTCTLSSLPRAGPAQTPSPAGEPWGSETSNGAGMLFTNPVEMCPAEGAALKPLFFAKHHCRLSSSTPKIRGYY